MAISIAALRIFNSEIWSSTDDFQMSSISPGDEAAYYWRRISMSEAGRQARQSPITGSFLHYPGMRMPGAEIEQN
jgi:hypothetical protein